MKIYPTNHFTGNRKERGSGFHVEPVEKGKTVVKTDRYWYISRKNQPRDCLTMTKVGEAVAKYRPYSYSQGQFIPVFFNKQIQEGTFDHSLIPMGVDLRESEKQKEVELRLTKRYNMT